MSDRIGPNTPPTVFDAEGRAVVLGGRIGRGGESYVYRAVHGDHLVAKIYLRRNDAERAAVAAKEQKILAMLTQRPPEPVEGHTAWAWPEGVLYDAEGDFRGFIMPEIRGQTMPLGLVYNRSYIQREAPQMTWAFLVKVARNLATCVHVLHDSDIVVGDLNETNVLVDSRARVSFVDCDSMQITDPHGHGVYRCPVGKPFLTPPELQGVRFSDVDRSAEHDAFCLALLTFHLLMGGIHPFEIPPPEHGDPPPIEDNIRAGRTPYSPRSRYQPLRETVPMSAMPTAIQRLFARALGPGLENPSVRPAPREWIAALHVALSDIARCPRDPAHAYASHLKACPWCAMDEARAVREDRAEAAAAQAAPADAPAEAPSRAPVRMQPERASVTAPAFEPPRPRRALRLPTWPAALLIVMVVGAVAWRAWKASRPVQTPDRPASAPADDHADDELGASSLSIGVPTRGVVDAAGDRDLFRLELYGATPVRLEVESSDVLACSLRWPDGSEEPMPACLVEQDLAPGRYHVVVTSDVAHARYTVRASRSGAL